VEEEKEGKRERREYIGGVRGKASVLSRLFSEKIIDLLGFEPRSL